MLRVSAKPGPRLQGARSWILAALKVSGLRERLRAWAAGPKAVLLDAFPRLGTFYWKVRDCWPSAPEPPQLTPLRFRFAGHPAMVAGTFEPAVIAFMREALPSTDVFVDAGAHVGFYTCLARQLGVHTIAIEPIPSNLRQLRANLEANGWSDTQVFPVALDDRAGTVCLFGGGTGASTIAGWAGARGAPRRLLPALPLDSVLGDRLAGARALIKVDVEGHEFAVLQGGRATLARVPRPTWVVETCLSEHHPSGSNPLFVRVFEEFWMLGYTARTLGPDPITVDRGVLDRWVAARQPDGGASSFVFS